MKTTVIGIALVSFEFDVRFLYTLLFGSHIGISTMQTTFLVTERSFIKQAKDVRTNSYVVPDDVLFQCYKESLYCGSWHLTGFLNFLIT